MSVVSSKYRGSKEFLLVYCELIHAAQTGGLITYQDMARIMGLPLSGQYMAKETGQMLGEISEDEVRNGRPMLSVLAVRNTGKPGPGLYVLARQLGRLTGDSSLAKDSFWKQEREAIYNTWQSEPAA